MTAQINDLFNLRGIEYFISGISCGELLDVKTLGIDPVGTCTACWRGYQLVAALDLGKRLILDRLNVSLADNNHNYKPNIGPEINQVKPTGPKDKYDRFNNHYNQIKLPLKYTGGLLITRDFIKKLYVHMGFHPAWKYKVVIELIFEDGLLVNEFDRTGRMAEIRKEVVGNSKTNAGTTRSEKKIEDWIARCFDRTYR